MPAPAGPAARRRGQTADTARRAEQLTRTGGCSHSSRTGSDLPRRATFGWVGEALLALSSLSVPRLSVSRLLVPMGRAVGILCRCALCDSYFVLELGTVDLTVYRGKKGKAALMDYFESLQARYDTTASESASADGSSDREFRDGRERSANGHEFMRCPTCVEATHGMRYAEWVARGGVFAASGRHSLGEADSESEPEPERVSDAMTVSNDEDVALSLVEFVSFDETEAPPLFLNEQGAPGKKPKWTLCQGVGPPALEVDSSRSGRVFKPSLRPFGIDRQMYQPLDAACVLSRQEHVDICTAVYNAVSLHNVNPADIFAVAPVFLEWTKESSSIRSIVEEAAEAAAERDRVAASIKTAGMIVRGHSRQAHTVQIRFAFLLGCLGTSLSEIVVAAIHLANF